MTAAVRTPQRPDDCPRVPRILAEVPAEVGHPYVLQRRPGRSGLGTIRLARLQANGHTVSFMLGPTDARNLAAALVLAADELESNQ